MARRGQGPGTEEQRASAQSARPRGGRTHAGRRMDAMPSESVGRRYRNPAASRGAATEGVRVGQDLLQPAGFRKNEPDLRAGRSLRQGLRRVGGLLPFRRRKGGSPEVSLQREARTV